MLILDGWVSSMIVLFADQLRVCHAGHEIAIVHG
jgi:hypothetical protein